jgi:hypothetical protein
MGKVTVSTAARSITFAGNNTELTMGTLDCSYPTVTSAGVIYTANGPGNALVINSYNIRSEPLNNAVDNIEGSANWTFNGVIANGNASTNGLNIKSTGVTTFNGTNTYTGKTVVYSNATLRVNGSLVSPVTVTSNGIIGGTGTISALTVSTNGILEAALNSTWNTAGTLTFATNSIVRVVGGTPSGSTPYTLVVAATSISTNTMPILNPSFPGWELAVVGGTNLVLRTTGGTAMNSPPVITALQGFSVSENVSLGTVVGTVVATDADVNPTFSGWMLVSGNTGGVFAIGSDGKITVAGALNYEGTQSYNLGVTVSDGTATSVVGTVVVTVTNVAEYSDVFGSSNPTADDNGDGIPNLMAYALGATSPSSVVAPPALNTADSTKLTITALIRINDPKVSVVGEYGLTLGTWEILSPITGVPSGSQIGAVAGVTQRQDFSVPRGTDPTKFMHLQATQAP